MSGGNGFRRERRLYHPSKEVGLYNEWWPGSGKLSCSVSEILIAEADAYTGTIFEEMDKVCARESKAMILRSGIL